MHLLSKAKVSVVLTTDQVNALRDIAVQRQLSLSDVVREAVRLMLDTPR
jgi:Arc/MetJ-type ribon-helix-helix transcriptional regulator